MKWNGGDPTLWHWFQILIRSIIFVLREPIKALLIDLLMSAPLHIFRNKFSIVYIYFYSFLFCSLISLYTGASTWVWSTGISTTPWVWWVWSTSTPARIWCPTPRAAIWQPVWRTPAARIWIWSPTRRGTSRGSTSWRRSYFMALVSGKKRSTIFVLYHSIMCTLGSYT